MSSKRSSGASAGPAVPPVWLAGGLILLAVIALGLLFREDTPETRLPDTPRQGPNASTGGGVVLNSGGRTAGGSGSAGGRSKGASGSTGGGAMNSGGRSAGAGPASTGTAPGPTPMPGRTSDGRALQGSQIVIGLDRLVARAERIVVGSVTDKIARLDESSGHIFTYYTIAVQRDLRGNHGLGETTVRVIGGRLPDSDLEEHVSHQPSFEIGDEGVFFLDDDEGLWTNLAGARQGAMVFGHPAPGKRSVRDGFGRPVYGLESESGHFVTAPTPERDAPIGDDDIVSAIQSRLKR